MSQSDGVITMGCCQSNDVLSFDEFQTNVLSTCIYPKEIGLMYTTLGLAGEAGEIANKVKKVLRDDKGVLSDDKRLAIIDELGDVLFYVGALASELGVSLEDVAKSNNLKLASRKARGTLQGSGDKR